MAFLDLPELLRMPDVSPLGLIGLHVAWPNLLAAVDLKAPPVPTNPSSNLRLALIIGAIVLVLIVLVVLYLWLRARRRAEGEIGMRPNRLQRVYNRFLRPLPWRARRALRTYPWIVVLGDAGAGKTQLINGCVDWQGQANQFFPSYTTDPLLQIYLGSKVIVHEVAAPLLGDSSRAAQAALRRLWQPLMGIQPPMALIVLSVRALYKQTPEQIQRHAQLLRGKLNLLSEIIGQPVRTRVVLTYMDRADGFGEYVRLLHQNGIAIHVPLRDDEGHLVSLEGGVTHHEKYLPLALTSFSAVEFRTLVEFLVRSPNITSQVGECLRILGEEIAFSMTPAFDRLYFYGQGLESKLPNPFHARFLLPGIPLHKLAGRGLSFLRTLFDFAPLRTHVIGCTLVALLAALVYGSIYRNHTRKVEDADTAVERLEVAIGRSQTSLNPPSESQAVRAAAGEAGNALLRVRASEEGKPLIWRLRQDDKASQRARFVSAVRRAYLLPALERHRQPSSRDRFIYTLGAVYAGRRNSLGEEVRRAPAVWAAAVPMPEEVLLKYVDLSDPAWSERVPVSGNLAGADANVRFNAAADLGPWLNYLTVMDAAFAGPTITALQLQRVQAVTRRFNDALLQAQKNRAAEHVLRILSEETAVDLKYLFGPALAALMPPGWLSDNADSLMGLFQLVLSSSLDGPRADQMNLTDLMNLLTTSPDAAKQAPKDVVYSFELLGKSFKFSTVRWLELLTRSRRHDVLRAVTGGSSEPDRSLSPTKLTALQSDAGAGEGSGAKKKKRRRHHHHHAKKKSTNVAEARTSGDAGHSHSERDLDSGGSDSVPAIYTRVGFEREMKPSLVDAEKRLPTAPLAPEQRQALERYLLDQARRYARNYRDAQVAYLLGYHPKADTLPAVLALLDDLQQPSSPLLERLRVVADNLNLGKLEGPFFAPLAEQLASLAPILKLGMAKDGAYPEYEKYKVLLARLARDLSGEDAAPATPMAAAATEKAGADKGGKAPAMAADPPTSAARVALLNLQGVEGSPQQKLDTYLDAAGLAGDLRRPFLVPLLRVHRLGLADIESAIDSRWAEEHSQRIRPLLDRFPFTRQAKVDVAIADLAALKPPEGAIYQFVQRQIAPMYSEKPDGTLVPLKNALGTLKLSDSVLATASRLRRLTRALWTPEGAERPIALSVKPMPLPPVGGSEQVVTQTFLTCSNVSVYGFNQMPESKPFPLPWWRQETAAAGIELGKADSKTRRYQSIDVASSPWSFYRLLEKATWEGLTATWRIENEAPGPARAVRFAFDGDPWALFKVSSSRPSRERN
ncbi:MAG: hypothetical protein JNJ46_13155 [Myxococcales bacterium]|nr:hypothetical protein [Myxococcales bacterium]